MNWTEIILSIVSTIVVPYALVLAQQWANANAKEKALARWTAGAASFAAQAYLDVGKARAANPGASLQAVVDGVARSAAVKLMQSYKETAEYVGATQPDAVSKVTGEISKLLAADSTVSVVEPKK